MRAKFDSLPASLDSCCDFTVPHSTSRPLTRESGVDEGPRPGPSRPSIANFYVARVYLSLNRGDVLLPFTVSPSLHQRNASSDTGHHTNNRPRRLLILAYARKAITISVLARRNNTLTVALSSPKKPNSIE